MDSWYSLREAVASGKVATWEQIKARMLSEDGDSPYSTAFVPQDFFEAMDNGGIPMLPLLYSRKESLLDNADVIVFADNTANKGYIVQYLVQVYDKEGHGTGFRFDENGDVYPTEAMRGEEFRTGRSSD